MGVIVNLPDERKNYAAISHETILVNKEFIHTQEGATMKYCVRGTLLVWDDEDCYKRKDLQFVLARTTVSIHVDSPPSDVYKLIYDKYKETLYSYEDDN